MKLEVVVKTRIRTTPFSSSTGLKVSKIINLNYKSNRSFIFFNTLLYPQAVLLISLCMFTYHIC